MSVAKVSKTNAARILEGLGIPFELHMAEVDESDLSAVTMAHKLGARFNLPHHIGTEIIRVNQQNQR